MVVSKAGRHSASHQSSSGRSIHFYTFENYHVSSMLLVCMVTIAHGRICLQQRVVASFLRLGASAFGGPSMVAYIGKMAAEKKRWMSRPSLMDGVALCQLIPGATAMQTSAYVGLKTRKVMGEAASFVGFGFPAFLLMMEQPGFDCRCDAAGTGCHWG